MSGVTFQSLDGREAAECEDGILALHADVYSGGSAGDGDDGYARWLRVWRRQPGFALATPWHGGYLVCGTGAECRCGRRRRGGTS
ncbi:MAG: hypothetical protein J2P26_01350 [Nocardiopsaceae bacterium]|nr:hypothetical protein [Nocardiopsaceae bacterium]